LMIGGWPDGGGVNTAADGIISISVPPTARTARSGPSHVVILVRETISNQGQLRRQSY